MEVILCLSRANSTCRYGRHGSGAASAAGSRGRPIRRGPQTRRTREETHVHGSTRRRHRRVFRPRHPTAVWRRRCALCFRRWCGRWRAAGCWCLVRLRPRFRAARVGLPVRGGGGILRDLLVLHHGGLRLCGLPCLLLLHPGRAAGRLENKRFREVELLVRQPRSGPVCRSHPPFFITTFASRSKAHKSIIWQQCAVRTTCA